MASYTTLCVLSAIACLFAEAIDKQCQEEISSLTVTSTRLQLSTGLVTVTNVNLRSVYKSLTTTECRPSTVSQIQLVTRYARPQLAVPATDYVTEIHLGHRKVIYTLTDYVSMTVTIAHTSQDVENSFKVIEATLTSTTVTVIARADITSQFVTDTVASTVVDISTSMKHVPLYVSRTNTNVFPSYQTVYQHEYVKHTTTETTVVTSYSTVYQCAGTFFQDLFAYSS